MRQEEEAASKSRGLGFGGRETGSSRGRCRFCMCKTLTQPRVVAGPRAGASLGRAVGTQTHACTATAAGVNTNPRVVVVGPAMHRRAVVAHFLGDSLDPGFGVDIKHAGIVTELARGIADIVAALPSGPNVLPTCSKPRLCAGGKPGSS